MKSVQKEQCDYYFNIPRYLKTGIYFVFGTGTYCTIMEKVFSDQNTRRVYSVHSGFIIRVTDKTVIFHKINNAILLRKLVNNMTCSLGFQNDDISLNFFVVKLSKWSSLYYIHITINNDVFNERKNNFRWVIINSADGLRKSRGFAVTGINYYRQDRQLSSRENTVYVYVYKHL